MARKKTNERSQEPVRDRSHDTEALVHGLLETAAVFERRLDRALSFVRGVSFSEYRLLRSLSQAHGHALTRVDLAERLGLTPSAVSRALKPLEKIGFVTTVKSERDARQALASLTPAGLELVHDAQGVVADAIADSAFAQLSGQEATQIEMLLDHLRYKQ